VDERGWEEDPDAPPETADPESESPAAAPPSDRPTTLPPWARFPHVNPSRQGRAFDDHDVRAPESRADETERILREIDGLRDEVRSRKRSPAERPESTPSEPVEAPVEPVETPSEPAPELAPTPTVPPTATVAVWESPSSFLEERLRLADAAASDLGRDVRSMAETWSRLRGRMEQLETEVKSAHQEIEFIHVAARGGDSLPKELPAGRAAAPTPTPAAIIAPTAPVRAPSVATPVVAAPASAAYTAFTADRYNKTIGALKARRRRLAAWTFVAAGLISLVLVAVTATAKEGMPPMWLAVLPAVWMIPVPFFVLSFRGTQRVIRHNHLEVPGGPP
jgi:hypothetical protein